MQESTCRIPVTATYRMIDGKPVMIDAEWANIPADTIARFLIQKCGVDAILNGGNKENEEEPKKADTSQTSLF